MYKGKILAGFAAFKAHATFGYWNGSQVLDDGCDRSAAPWASSAGWPRSTICRTARP